MPSRYVGTESFAISGVTADCTGSCSEPNWEWMAKSPSCDWSRDPVHPWHRLPQERVFQGSKRALLGFWDSWSLKGPFCCGTAEGWETAGTNHYHNNVPLTVPQQTGTPWSPCVKWFILWGTRECSARLAHPLIVLYGQCINPLERGDCLWVLLCWACWKFTMKWSPSQQSGVTFHIW